MNRSTKLILLLIIIVGSVLRLAGIFDDFWLDEIWSYFISQQLHRPLDVLLSRAARIDNNHPLNTLLMWIMGEQPNWCVYRMPSLLAGIGSILLVLHITLRRGLGQAILATALVALSYPLIHYSSEARGYSMAVFFALAAFDVFELYSARPNWLRAGLFAVFCALGLLAHLSFVHVYLGLLVLTAYRLPRAASVKVAAFEALRLHLLPMASLLAIHVTFVAKMGIGGTLEKPIWIAVSASVTDLLAMPGQIEYEVCVTLAAAVLFVGMLVALHRRGSDLWVFLVVAVLVSPVAATIRQAMTLDHIPMITARYFLVTLPLVLVMGSEMLVEILKKRQARPVVCLMLAAFFAASLWQTFWFLKIGRGHYSRAVAYMASQTPGAVIHVESDHILRTQMVLDFYKRVLPPGMTLATLDLSRTPPPPPPPIPPTWVVVHSFVQGSPPGSTPGSPAPPITDPWGGVFIFDREFTYYGRSGLSWYVYRRRL
jgi:hypothetical protein